MAEIIAKSPARAKRKGSEDERRPRTGGLAGIAIRNRPSDDAKRRTFYVDMLKSIKITAGAAIRQPPCRETRKPKRKR